MYSAESHPEHQAGYDNLGLKEKLEQYYYGQTFDDNLHIQIIYNILDIEKILAVYIANAAAAIDNLGDQYANVMEEDFIAFENLLKTNRLGYFGLEILTKEPKDEKETANNEKIKKRLYHLTALIGNLRQWSFHWTTIAANPSWLYQLEDSLHPEYLETLDYYFDKRFNDVNTDFLKTNSLNLFLLSQVFRKDDINELAKLYYEFIVLKPHKNLGFSIQRLREMMLDRSDAAWLKGKKLHSSRNLLYKLLDFTLFRHFQNHPEQAEQIVQQLRCSRVVSRKEQIYSHEATKLWNQYRRSFFYFGNHLMNKDIITAHQKKAPTSDMLRHFKQYQQENHLSYFSKLMYALCIFLDGKEINTLLTSLIHSFDNIASQLNVAKELGIHVSLKSEYAFFDNSSQYVPEIRIIKTFARMSKPNPSVKWKLFRDALDILGIPSDKTEEQLEEEIKAWLDCEKKKGKKPNHNFRNFIKNNVIKSSRFIYVVKFCNPKTINRIAKNHTIVTYVLSKIPESQIESYYSSCFENPSQTSTTNEKIVMLANMLSELNFEKFTNVLQGSIIREDQLKKERFKAIVGLYLTVLFLVVKNLVNVNARYIMAFHCVERDAQLYYGINLNGKYLKLVNKLYGENECSKNRYLARNRKQREYVRKNIENANRYGLNIKEYRNKVAHLTFIRTCYQWIGNIRRCSSYFALYHYIVQMLFATEIDKITPEHIPEQYPYYKALYHYNTYVKDFVKALNSPFGYNTPRFKNLTIEELFDRNTPPETITPKEDSTE